MVGEHSSQVSDISYETVQWQAGHTLDFEVIYVTIIYF